MPWFDSLRLSRSRRPGRRAGCFAKTFHPKLSLVAGRRHSLSGHSARGKVGRTLPRNGSCEWLCEQRMGSGGF